MLVNIPQCTGQLPRQRIIWPQMPVVPKLRKCDLCASLLFQSLTYPLCSCSSSVKYLMLSVTSYMLLYNNRRKKNDDPDAQSSMSAASQP